MFKELIIFMIGAGAGFAGATILLKSKYDHMANEEIESMREYVKSKIGDSDTEPKDNEKESKAEFEEYVGLTVNYNTISSTKEEKKVVENKPYILSEEDFITEDEDYTKISLEYYPESGLVYEGTDIINPEETIGRDSLEVLDDFNNDVIYVRNENFEIDYEVIKVPGRGPESESYA